MARVIVIRGRRRERHERQVEELLLAEVRVGRDVPDVGARLEVVCREGRKGGVVGVEHDVAAEVYELDEEALPRARPAIRAHGGDDGRGEGPACERGKTGGEVGVELTPVLGEVERAPAAGDLREVGRVGMREAGAGEGGARVEELAALGMQLEVLLLVEADAEEVGGAVFGSAVAG